MRAWVTPRAPRFRATPRGSSPPCGPMRGSGKTRPQAPRSMPGRPPSSCFASERSGRRSSGSAATIRRWSPHASRRSRGAGHARLARGTGRRSRPRPVVRQRPAVEPGALAVELAGPGHAPPLSRSRRDQRPGRDRRPQRNQRPQQEPAGPGATSGPAGTAGPGGTGRAHPIRRPPEHTPTPHPKRWRGIAQPRGNRRTRKATPTARSQPDTAGHATGERQPDAVARRRVGARIARWRRCRDATTQ